MGLFFSVASLLQETIGTQPLRKRLQVEDGVTLYGCDKSPACQRVTITLLEKGISFRYVHIDTSKGEELSEEFRSLSSNRGVPVIRFQNVPGVENCVLYESNAITEFLDCDAFPEPKLYPINVLERARVKTWQDWELGLCDDKYLDLLPADLSSREQEYLSKVGVGGSLQKDAEEERKSFICYQHLAWLEQALEGQDYLVGNFFTSADISVLPRLAAYSMKGLRIPKQYFPNVRAYMARVGGRISVQKSQRFLTTICDTLANSFSQWLTKSRVSFDISACIERAKSMPLVDLCQEPGWVRRSHGVPWDAVLVADCICCPVCWQVKLLLKVKGIEFMTYPLSCQEVEGRWAGSCGFLRISHHGQVVVGIRAVLDYVERAFPMKARLLPDDPVTLARVNAWQAWDQALGYQELAPLIEMQLNSKFIYATYKTALSVLYALKDQRRYKFLPILRCFIYGALNNGVETCEMWDSLENNYCDEVKAAVDRLDTTHLWESLLDNRLIYLDNELKKQPGSYIIGSQMTLADIILFCRLCFFWGLGILAERQHEDLAYWFEMFKETHPDFYFVSGCISDTFHKLNF